MGVCAFLFVLITRQAWPDISAGPLRCLGTGAEDHLPRGVGLPSSQGPLLRHAGAGVQDRAPSAASQGCGQRGEQPAGSPGSGSLSYSVLVEARVCHSKGTLYASSFDAGTKAKSAELFTCGQRGSKPARQKFQIVERGGLSLLVAGPGTCIDSSTTLKV